MPVVRRHSVTVSDLSEATAMQLVQAMEIYGGSFPSNESRPEGDVMSLLARGKYVMSVAVQSDTGRAASAVGFMLMYPLDHHAVLLDYMAVRSDVRGCGIGGIMMKHVREHVLKQHRTVLLEVQLPSGDGVAAKLDRIRFYEGHDAVTLTDEYVMPGYGADSEERMKLMYIGAEPASLDDAIGEIHSKVYGRRAPHPKYMGSGDTHGNGPSSRVDQ